MSLGRFVLRLLDLNQPPVDIESPTREQAEYLLDTRFELYTRFADGEVTRHARSDVAGPLIPRCTTHYELEWQPLVRVAASTIAPDLVKLAVNGEARAYRTPDAARWTALYTDMLERASRHLAEAPPGERHTIREAWTRRLGDRLEELAPEMPTTLAYGELSENLISVLSHLDAELGGYRGGVVEVAERSRLGTQGDAPWPETRYEGPISAGRLAREALLNTRP